MKRLPPLPIRGINPASRKHSVANPGRPPLPYSLSRLERLPPELVLMITSYLPVKSTIILHRTSKTLYLLVPLDQSFWRSALLKGALIPWLWYCGPEDPKALSSLPGPDRDWRCLVWMLQQVRPHWGFWNNGPKGLKNRFRIWNIAQRMGDRLPAEPVQSRAANCHCPLETPVSYRHVRLFGANW